MVFIFIFSLLVKAFFLESGLLVHVSSHDADAHDVAPLADLFVVETVDAFVFPNRTRAGGGQRRGVEVIGDGVEREEHKEAVAAVHPDFHAVHALLDPAHVRVARLQRQIEAGFERARMGCPE